MNGPKFEKITHESVHGMLDQMQDGESLWFYYKWNHSGQDVQNLIDDVRKAFLKYMSARRIVWNDKKQGFR